MPPLRQRRLIDRLDSPFWMLMSGVLLGFSFPPSPFYGFACVALVPMLVRWSRLQLGWMLFRETYSAFLIMSAIAGHWVLFHERALTALTSGMGLLVMPLPMAFPVVASAVVMRRFGVGFSFVVLVAMSLMVEYFVLHGPLALPWLLLGNTQADALLINQFAEFTGIGGLSLWLWLLNGALFWMLRTTDLTRQVGLGLTAATLLFAPIGYSTWRLPQLEEARETLRVGIVQPAVQPEEWADVHSGQRVDLLARLTREQLIEHAPAADRPALVVWPETALPVFPDARQQARLYERLQAWTRHHDVALLTGAITRYDTAPALTVEPFQARKRAEATPYYNSALLFGDHDRPQQYDKLHMIPFAERVPLMEWRPALAALGVAAGGVGGYGLGGTRTLFEANEAAFGTLICFESLFGDHARRFVQNGAAFLVTISQDGWWGKSAGYRQHFALSRLRAIETRRAVVMASVTGTSGLIQPDGRAPQTIGWMDQSARTLDVPLLQAQTFYTRHGDWVGLAAVAVSGLMALTWMFVIVFFPSWRAPSMRISVPNRRVLQFQ